jgi:hypothetical protein
VFHFVPEDFAFHTAPFTPILKNKTILITGKKLIERSTLIPMTSSLNRLSKNRDNRNKTGINFREKRDQNFDTTRSVKIYLSKFELTKQSIISFEDFVWYKFCSLLKLLRVL